MQAESACNGGGEVELICDACMALGQSLPSAVGGLSESVCRRCDGWRMRSLRGWNLPDRIRSAIWQDGVPTHLIFVNWLVLDIMH